MGWTLNEPINPLAAANTDKKNVIIIVAVVVAGAAVFSVVVLACHDEVAPARAGPHAKAALCGTAHSA